MPPEQVRSMDDLLNQLLLSLSLAVNNLESVIEQSSEPRQGRFRFGFKAKKAAWVWKKEALDEIISELELWQRRFDPSWYLLIKIASPVIDHELAIAKATEPKTRGPATAAKNPLTLAASVRTILSPSVERTRSLFLPELQMDWMNIPFSDAKAGRREGDSKWYVVDSIEFGQAIKVRDIARDVRVLAAKLSQADPLAFGLLNCKGLVPIRRQPASPMSPPFGSELTPPSAIPRAHSPSPNQNDYCRFDVIFRIPQGMEVLQSLRQLLLNSDEQISLSRKINISREICKAVCFVSTLGFVHKNIRPESVLCFEDPEATRSHAFLVGFDAFRAADAGTMMGGDMSWARNVYRHPRRQGMDPSEKYTMKHDIYSLGVCLLEIGLWESFVEYTTDLEFDGPPQPKFGKSYHDFRKWNQEQGEAGSFSALAFQLKDFLVEQALTRLSPRMGDRYRSAVISCLTVLDEDNEDFGGLEEEESDEIVAVQFIERIMKTLDTISL
ncbi:hypothetical protein N7462_000512 [Penicillium macrosclerotiorum]|uniref:uncharacterized protein n=1 Tax=Penicillium macrosclerotiorum TaxID=303699 RepID=UPI002548603B|nr:uncharacterized protein N7462_000512 [Penicillium macrosclerotiorum]KAJ5698507.1 hypothetical protein N7462_000512 [Penicillium macrosclerotiorum]